MGVGEPPAQYIELLLIELYHSPLSQVRKENLNDSLTLLTLKSLRDRIIRHSTRG